VAVAWSISTLGISFVFFFGFFGFFSSFLSFSWLPFGVVRGVWRASDRDTGR
jgi:hypothetical protein